MLPHMATCRQAREMAPPHPSQDELRLLREGAVAGDASAQLRLGLCFSNGMGVDQNYRCIRANVAKG
jgi:TPR repeat protein